MRRIDHVRKTVYIIVGCLTIISLVLTICHKVGHCASSDNSVSGFYPITEPLPINGSYFGSSFNVDQEVIDSILDVSTNSYDSAIVVYEESTSQNYVTFEVFQFNNGFEVLGHHSNGLEGWFTWRFNVSHTCHVKYDFNNNTASVVGNFGGGNSGTGVSYNSFSQLPNNQYYLPYHTYCFEYPVWVNGGSLSYNGSTYFQDYVVNGFSGHSKGGVLSNYIDSDDLIEQDSSLPTVDTTPPSDPSSNSGWFQKILNGLSKINQSIKGGVLTIGDYIGQGFENVINWLTEPFDQEAFSDELDQVFLLSDILGAKDLLDQSGIFDWEDITPSQNVSWTFDFGGAVLPHTSCTIDFSWYTGTVKNIIVTLICTFLVVGLLATLFNSIPSIISGHSGDKGGGSDS